MIPRQADYLADLSRRAEVAVDESLDVAEASERIAALIDAESHGHHHQQAPIEVPGRQRQRTATFDPYLDQAKPKRPSRPPRTCAGPPSASRSPAEIIRSERIRSPEEIARSKRLRTPAEIRAEEEGQSTEQDQDQDASGHAGGT